MLKSNSHFELDFYTRPYSLIVFLYLSRNIWISIEYNKENYPLLNQIYDIIEETQNQNKKIILSKVPAYMEIKGKQDMPGTIPTMIHYIKPCIEDWKYARNNC